MPDEIVNYFHLSECEKDKAIHQLTVPCVCASAEPPARTERPQETTKFARQVTDPPGGNGSVMKLIYMV